METTFAEALADLIAEYFDPNKERPHDTIISAMELQIMALKEEAGAEE